jgi:23S rRNA (guanosine2251-2'-O)-methyltransferase
VIIYGRNSVHEAMRGPRQVLRMWATKNAAREGWLTGQRLEIASAEELESRCGSSAHQGVCAEVSPFRYADGDQLVATPGGLIVALDQVQDPQNLGAIARSAECAGVAGLVLPERRSAEVTPAVCKASAGAVEHLPIAKVRNLADFLGQAKRRGMWCYGADAGGAVRHDELDFTGAAVLVFGSEGRGLRPRVAASCDALVSIPLHGRVRSLSVAAAAAVLMFAAATGRERQGNLQNA